MALGLIEWYATAYIIHLSHDGTHAICRDSARFKYVCSTTCLE